MKRLSYLIAGGMLLCIFMGCSSRSDELELTDPGFGITATRIKAADSGVDIPVLLQSDDPIKGLQFTLEWNPKLGQVIKPVMTEKNAGFTISTSEVSGGVMKVLAFSMSGDQLDTSDPVIMHIPIRITDSSTDSFELLFQDVIFAGPAAASYDIPITHAKLKVIH